MHVTSAVGSRSDALHAFFIGLILTVRTPLDQRLRLKRNSMNRISPRTPDKQNCAVVEYTRCRVKTTFKLTNLKINSRIEG